MNTWHENLQSIFGNGHHLPSQATSTSAIFIRLLTKLPNWHVEDFFETFDKTELPPFVHASTDLAMVQESDSQVNDILFMLSK